MLRGVVLSVALLAAVPARADMIEPAELPPSDYAGQQYVDSKGCLFVRAGQDTAREVWVPRVTRDGKPMCGNPPSGQRVPVVEDEASVTTQPAQVVAAVAGLPAEDATEPASATAPGYFVAVGSFGLTANTDTAVARLKELNYPVVRGRMAGESDTLITVFAGPFPDAEDAAQAQVALKGAGFPDATLTLP